MMKLRSFALAAVCALALTACIDEPVSQPGPPPSDGPVIPDSECPRRDGQPCR